MKRKPAKVVWKSDPLRDVVRAFRRLYPRRACDIVVQPVSGKKLGRTFFARGHRPMVALDPRVSYAGCIDILAHELAHVAAGINGGHGPRWAKAYDAIRDEYEAAVQRSAKRIGVKSVAVSFDERK